MLPSFENVLSKNGASDFPSPFLGRRTTSGEKPQVFFVFFVFFAGPGWKSFSTDVTGD